MTKIVFFDIDGTLRSFRDGTVADSTLRALHTLREKGVKLFIATGRGMSQMGFMDEIFRFDGIVAQNGQYCRIGDEVVRKALMDPQDVRTLIDTVPCLLESEDDMVLTRGDSVTSDGEDSARAVFQALGIKTDKLMPPDWDIEQVIKGIVFVNEENEPKLHAVLKNSQTFRWHPLFCDIGCIGGGKDVGIDAVLDRLGIPLCDSMAFGDGENDLEMLRHVACGVAMGNAEDKVKAAADYVTDSVDEDGIANALRHFGLI